MRMFLPLLTVALAAAVGAGCTVARAGLNAEAGPADDLGPLADLGIRVDLGERVDLGTIDGSRDPDLGVASDLGSGADLGSDGGSTGSCVAATCAGRFCAGGVCGYARSCIELRTAGVVDDGLYTLDGDGPGGLEPASAYCDMTNAGGGWTLVLKADGEFSTFAYDSELWTNTMELAGSSDLAAIEAKLRSYVNVAFTQMRIVMTSPSGDHSLLMDVGAASCVALFTRGRSTTTVGRMQWLDLVPGSALQPNCQEQGINVAPAPTFSRVRIGLIGNGEAECNSPDSWIGIGGGGGGTMSVGNYANSASSGTRAIVSFGYVFVR